MSDDRTRVIPRSDSAPSPPPVAAPRIVDGQIVFFCPEGHRLVVPTDLAGKRGKCSKCSVPLQIPELAAMEHATVAPEPQPEPEPTPPSQPAQPPAPAPADDDADWTFISGIGPATESSIGPASGWPDPGPGVDAGSAINPMALLLARLWAERDHGGIVELHLVGGAVLLPEEFSGRWSGGSHGVFATQAADGSVTLTAVAWDTVQRIVVRQLTAVPDDMFD